MSFTKMEWKTTETNPKEILDRAGVDEKDYSPWFEFKNFLIELNEITSEVESINLKDSVLGYYNSDLLQQKKFILEAASKLSNTITLYDKINLLINQVASDYPALIDLKKHCVEFIKNAIEEVYAHQFEKNKNLYIVKQREQANLIAIKKLNEKLERITTLPLPPESADFKTLVFNIDAPLESIQGCFDLIREQGFRSSLYLQLRELDMWNAGKYRGKYFSSGMFYDIHTKLTNEYFELKEFAFTLEKNCQEFPAHIKQLLEEFANLFKQNKIVLADLFLKKDALINELHAVKEKHHAETFSRRAKLASLSAFAPIHRIPVPADENEINQNAFLFLHLITNPEYAKSIGTWKMFLSGITTDTKTETINELIKAFTRSDDPLSRAYAVLDQQRKIIKLKKKLKELDLPCDDFKKLRKEAVGLLDEPRQKLYCAILMVHAFLQDSKHPMLQGKKLSHFLEAELFPILIPKDKPEILIGMKNFLHRQKLPENMLNI